MIRRLIGGEFENRANISGKGKIDDLIPEGRCFSLWGGAASALRVLSMVLKLGPGDIILFPSYLCPSILDPFRQAGVTPRFYRVDRKLIIDIGHLEECLNESQRIKAVFFINYFGFLQPPQVLTYLREIRKRGFVVIEDGVQSLFSKGAFTTGDWGVASLRKWLYIDTGILVCDNSQVYPGVQPVQGFSLYKVYKGLAIRARERFLHGGPGIFEKIYLNMLKKAEKCYSNDIRIRNLSLPDSLKLKSGVGWTTIIEQRRKNFDILSRELSGYQRITPIYDKSGEGVCPLGFPVVTEPQLRDQLVRALAAKGVFCPVHWDLKGNVPPGHTDSIGLSREILTIPIDQRYGAGDMEYVAACIKAIL